MAVTQYIGARYVPTFADPAEWNDTRTYEPLTIVTYQGNSYTSRQQVPTSIAITDEDYWLETGNYNAQVEAYRKEVLTYDARLTQAETGISANKNTISAEVKRATAAEQANATAIATNATAIATNATAIATNTTAISGIMAGLTSTGFRPPAGIDNATPLFHFEYSGDDTYAEGGCYVPDNKYVIAFYDGSAQTTTLRCYNMSGTVLSSLTINDQVENNLEYRNGKLMLSGANDKPYVYLIDISANGTLSNATKSAALPGQSTVWAAGFFGDDKWWYTAEFYDFFSCDAGTWANPTKLFTLSDDSYGDPNVAVTSQGITYDEAHDVFLYTYTNGIRFIKPDGKLLSWAAMKPIYNATLTDEVEQASVCATGTYPGIYFHNNNSQFPYWSRKKLGTCYKCALDGSAQTVAFVPGGEIHISPEYPAIYRGSKGSSTNIEMRYPLDAYALVMSNPQAHFTIITYGDVPDWAIILGNDTRFDANGKTLANVVIQSGFSLIRGLDIMSSSGDWYREGLVSIITGGAAINHFPDVSTLPNGAMPSGKKWVTGDGVIAVLPSGLSADTYTLTNSLVATKND